jgi:hypothetical protein
MRLVIFAAKNNLGNVKTIYGGKSYASFAGFVDIGRLINRQIARADNRPDEVRHDHEKKNERRREGQKKFRRQSAESEFKFYTGDTPY